MSATVTIRRSTHATLVEVDAGEDGQLPRDWLVQFRLAAQRAAVHPDDYQASDRTFAAARVRTHRSEALLALAKEIRRDAPMTEGRGRGTGGVGHVNRAFQTPVTVYKISPRHFPGGQVTARTPHGAKYGGYHQAVRTAALAALWANPATPCARCGLPMDPSQPSLLHLDHDDVTGGYVGLSHASCNTTAGGRLGQARRWGQRAPEGRRFPPVPEPVIPTGHTRGYCRECRDYDCGLATPDAPYGRQPW